MSLAILLGPPGAFVSECAGLLSQLTGLPYLDVNDAIEAATGASPERIVTTRGADELRKIESQLVAAILDSIDAGETKILALSSGALGDSDDDEAYASIRRRMADLAEGGATVIHLTGDLKTLVKRTGLGGPRIAAVESPRRIFYGHLKRREPLYASLSNSTIDTTGKSLSETAAEAARLIGYSIL